MYEYLEGKLVEKHPTHVVIDCGGVGYVLHISLNTYSRVGNGEKCRLFTHFVVREDAQQLFGFADKEEREVFRDLISVSGIGAATARMILSSMDPKEVQQAVLTGNVGALRSVKGIGEKTAQRVIIDLKGKFGKGEGINLSAGGNKLKEEALAALVMLGFAKNVSERAIEKAMNGTAEKTVEQLIKEALKHT